ncbi:MAG: hypothetical protein AB1414_13050, partial [bacterium]
KEIKPKEEVIAKVPEKPVVEEKPKVVEEVKPPKPPVPEKPKEVKLPEIPKVEIPPIVKEVPPKEEVIAKVLEKPVVEEKPKIVEEVKPPKPPMPEKPEEVKVPEIPKIEIPPMVKEVQPKEEVIAKVLEKPVVEEKPKIVEEVKPPKPAVELPQIVEKPKLPPKRAGRIIPRRLTNPDFSLDLKYWDKIETPGGKKTLQVIFDTKQYPKVFEYKRIGMVREKGELGISQSLNMDISNCNSLIIGADVKLIFSSLASDEDKLYPAMIELEYLDAQGNVNVWKHGFLYDEPYKESTLNYPDIGEKIPKNQWYSYSSPNLVEILSPQPQILTNLKVYGAGMGFKARIDNVSLAVEEGERPIEEPSVVIAELPPAPPKEEIKVEVPKPVEVKPPVPKEVPKPEIPVKLPELPPAPPKEEIKVEVPKPVEVKPPVPKELPKPEIPVKLPELPPAPPKEEIKVEVPKPVEVKPPVPKEVPKPEIPVKLPELPPAPPKEEVKVEVPKPVEVKPPVPKEVPKPEIPVKLPELPPPPPPKEEEVKPAVPEEAPPAKPEEILPKLTNPDFKKGLDHWQKFEIGYGKKEIDVIKESENYPEVLEFKRTKAGREKGELGIKQRLNMDISEYVYVVVKADIKVINASLANDGIEGGDYPMTIELEYADALGEIKSFKHGFLYRKEINYPEIGECIPKDKWYSYTSPNLIDLFTPKPRVIKGVKIYGCGVAFESRLANLQLVCEQTLPVVPEPPVAIAVAPEIPKKEVPITEEVKMPEIIAERPKKIPVEKKEIPAPPTQPTKLLTNGDFTIGLSNWEKIETGKGLNKISVMRDSDSYPNAFEFTRVSTEEGKLGISQSVWMPVSTFISLVLMADIKVIYSSFFGDKFVESSYPLILELEYMDIENKTHIWRKGFKYQGKITAPELEEIVKEKTWQTFVSTNLIKQLSPKPVVITKINIYGSGWGFWARVANIKLIGE